MAYSSLNITDRSTSGQDHFTLDETAGPDVCRRTEPVHGIGRVEEGLQVWSVAVIVFARLNDLSTDCKYRDTKSNLSVRLDR